LFLDFIWKRESAFLSMEKVTSFFPPSFPLLTFRKTHPHHSHTILHAHRSETLSVCISLSLSLSLSLFHSIRVFTCYVVNVLHRVGNRVAQNTHRLESLENLPPTPICNAVFSLRVSQHPLYVFLCSTSYYAAKLFNFFSIFAKRFLMVHVDFSSSC
jgi:hypothetical protein